MMPKLRHSYSANEKLRVCPRLYQLTRIKVNDMVEEQTPENNIHLDYGSAMGAGIQAMLLAVHNGHSKDLAIQIATVAVLASYQGQCDTPEKGKTLNSLLLALKSFHANWDWDVWDLAYFNGKPAIELSFKLVYDVESGDYYCGFVDAILRNRLTGEHAVLELKTTGMNLLDIKPLYSNSDQAIGYSLVLDALSGGTSSFTVLYGVIRVGKDKEFCPKTELHPFPKTAKDRLEWLLSQSLDYQRLKEYEELGVYPKWGASCIQYMRPCSMYGICDLAYWDNAPNTPEKDEIDWDFTFSLDDMITKAIGAISK